MQYDNAANGTHNGDDAAMRVELRKGLEIPVVRLTTLLAMKKEAGRPQDLADIDMQSGGRSLENR